MIAVDSLVIIVPVLRRPHRVAPLLESIEGATTEPHRVLFVGSPGDDAEHQAVNAAGAELLVIDEPPCSGDYARKINAGYRHTSELLLFLGADDLAFHPRWFEHAAQRLTDQVSVIGTNDLGNRRVKRGQHATHSLLTREYVNRFGTIDEAEKVLHEGYPHEYCDDELVCTAKTRRAWAFAADSIVEHLHPLWGKAPSDELYDARPQRTLVGQRIFEERRHLWM